LNKYVKIQELIDCHEDILKDVKRLSRKIEKKVKKIDSYKDGYLTTGTLKYINGKLALGNGESLAGILKGLIKGMKNG